MVISVIDIFYELINEAKEGKVIIDGECWPIGFNTIITEDNVRLGFEVEDYIEENLDTLSEEEIGSLQRNLSCLRINNKQVFFALLEDYINKELEVGRKSLKIYGPNKEKDTIKCLMAYLFVNATTEDFLNPCDFLIRRIKFLEDNTLSLFEDGQVLDLGPLFKGSKLFIKDSSQSVMMETPRKLELSFVKDDLEYKLPEISYGICEEMGKKVCYIYSFLDKQKKEFTDKREEKYFKEAYKTFFMLDDYPELESFFNQVYRLHNSNEYENCKLNKKTNIVYKGVIYENKRKCSKKRGKLRRSDVLAEHHSPIFASCGFSQASCRKYRQSENNACFHNS